MNEKDYDTIRKEIVINASVDKVYSSLIDADLLTQWFPSIATFEPWIGGRVFFRFSREVKKKKKDHDIIGTIISIIPNREISYTWNFTTKPEYNKNTIVTWKPILKRFRIMLYLVPVSINTIFGDNSFP